MNNYITKLKELASTRSILIVEDDKNVQSTIKEIFELFFDTIDIADDGQIGLEMIKQKQYDVILSDITMPNKNGIEMIKDAYEYNSGLRFIVLSAHSDAQYLMPLIDMGVERFIHKPFDSTLMMNRVIDVLKAIVSKETIDKQAQEILELNNFLKRKNQELSALSTTLEMIVYDDDLDINKFRENAKKHNIHHKPNEILNDTVIDLWLD